MPTNLVDDAAVIAAGYKKVQTDFGASANPRYQTAYTKPITGYAGGSGRLQQAHGVSNTSAAAADTAAVAALNGWRNHRYGFAAAGGNLGPAGTALTVDVH